MIAAYRRKLHDWIWDPAWQTRPFFVAWPMKTLRLLLAVVRDLQEGYLSLRATSLVYTTLLSLAPLLAICFSVLKGIGAHNQVEPFLQDFLEPLGEQGADITARIVGFVDNIQVGVLGAVGLAFLIYSVIALMHKIETAFNDIWHVANTRSLPLRLRDYMSVLLIGPLFLFLSVGMTTAMQHAAAVQEWLKIDLLDSAFKGVFLVLPYVLFGLAFAMLYMFMPNTRVRFAPAMVAGFVTGVLWKVLGKLFGVFVTGSASYAAIYSVFAALVLFIIWLYIGWLIVLTGASICYYLQNPSNQSISRKSMQLGTRVREKVALQICVEIGHHFYTAQHGLSLARLSARLRVPAIMIEGIVATLVDAGVLALTTERSPKYIPARPFDETTVEDMLAALQAADEAQVPGIQRIRSSAAVDDMMRRASDASRKERSGMTLKQLALAGGVA